MWLPKLVMLILSLYALTLESDAISCPKGQRVFVKKNVESCMDCPPNHFQDGTTSQSCKQCQECHKRKGSMTVETCKPERNTICRCRKNFVVVEDDSSICKCPSGFTELLGECIKMEEKKEEKTLLTILTSPRPHKRTPTQKPAYNITITTNAAITTSTAGQVAFTATTKEKTSHSHNSSIVVGLLCLMVALLVLTALICKENVLSRMKRQPESRREGSCRTPVEESGDGSQDSLKQNQES